MKTHWIPFLTLVQFLSIAAEAAISVSVTPASFPDELVVGQNYSRSWGEFWDDSGFTGEKRAVQWAVEELEKMGCSIVTAENEVPDYEVQVHVGSMFMNAPKHAGQFYANVIIREPHSVSPEGRLVRGKLIFNREVFQLIPEVTVIPFVPVPLFKDRRLTALRKVLKASDICND